MKAIQRRRVILSLLPLALILGFIYAYPLVKVCFNAFMGFTGSSAGKFVGLKNFALIKADIPKTVTTTLIWTFGSVIPAMLLGLMLALVCNRSFAGKKAVVSINLLPYAIPLIIVASCWRFVYNPDFRHHQCIFKENRTDFRFHQLSRVQKRAGLGHRRADLARNAVCVYELLRRADDDSRRAV